MKCAAFLKAFVLLYERKRHWWKEINCWVFAEGTDGDGSQNHDDNRSAELKEMRWTGHRKTRDPDLCVWHFDELNWRTIPSQPDVRPTHLCMSSSRDACRSRKAIIVMVSLYFVLTHNSVHEEKLNCLLTSSKRDNVHSRNHCCRWKALSITTNRARYIQLTHNTFFLVKLLHTSALYPGHPQAMPKPMGGKLLITENISRRMLLYKRVIYLCISIHVVVASIYMM